MFTDTIRLLPAAVAGAVALSAAAPVGQPASFTLANDRLALTIAEKGGTLSRLTISDGDSVNPFSSHGHFLALDGFGEPSPEEREAGMPFHGEASTVAATVVAQQAEGPVRSLTLRSYLPLAQQTLTRTIDIVAGEQVISITSDVRSHLAVDRPITWAEHATIGVPFLAQGTTVIDMPATHCRVRPYKPVPIPGRLAFEQDFMWPLAPAKDGTRVDLRTVPANSRSVDLASCLMEPSRDLAFVTALNIERGLLLGYVFRRADYPWLMSWMNYTGDDRAARGMEFSTQPFDVSHRETVAMNPLFDTPTFRWLAAGATIQTRFLLFYTRVPDGFSRIDDVTIADGKLTVIDESGRQLVLDASRGL